MLGNNGVLLIVVVPIIAAIVTFLTRNTRFTLTSGDPYWRKEELAIVFILWFGIVLVVYSLFRLFQVNIN